MLCTISATTELAALEKSKWRSNFLLYLYLYTSHLEVFYYENARVSFGRPVTENDKKK